MRSNMKYIETFCRRGYIRRVVGWMTFALSCHYHTIFFINMPNISGWLYEGMMILTRNPRSSNHPSGDKSRFDSVVSSYLWNKSQLDHERNSYVYPEPLGINSITNNVQIRFIFNDSDSWFNYSVCNFWFKQFPKVFISTNKGIFG